MSQADREAGNTLRFELGDHEAAARLAAQLADHVHDLRVAAVEAAENALTGLGAGEKDEVVIELRRYQKILKAAKTAQNFQLDKVLDIAAGKLPKSFAGEAKFSIQVIKKVRKALDAGLNVRDLEAALEKGDPEALVQVLKLAKYAAEYVTVAAPAMKRFLKFYAEGAEACLKAAVSIQNKLIAQDVEQLTAGTKNAPENKLYTEAEVKEAIFRMNPNGQEVRRIVTMLQVRRLLHLVKADSDTFIGLKP